MSNDSFARDFIALVKKGQRAAVERMLESDPSLVRATDEHGVSAILLARFGPVENSMRDATPGCWI